MSDGERPDPANAAEVWDRLQALPSIHEEPLVWDHRVGGFVRTPPPSAPAPAPPAPPAAPAPAPAAAAPPAAPAPRWREGIAGAGTDRPHVVIDAPGASPAAPPPPPSAAAAPAPMAPVAPAYRPPTPPPPARRTATPAARPPRGTAVPGRPPRKRRWVRRLLIALVLVPLVLFGGLFAFGWWKFSQIPRVDVAAVLSPRTGAGQNFLIVGTDSREGIDPNDPNAGAFLGEKVSGARTDSIMVMHVEGGSQSLLSIPRDLWVKDPKTQQMGRINATFEAGPANLIRTVQNLGIPVHHYVEINFVSFGRLVDAVGGIDVEFDGQARDLNSGLKIEQGGINHLDGTQALAYVRSRHYETLQANPKNPAKPIWVEDPLSDLSRVQRQRTFLTALMNEVTGTRNPIELNNITGAMSVGLKLDNALTFLDAIKLAWSIKGFAPESVTLPVTPRTTSGGAAVLDLKQAEAQPILARFSA